MRPRFKSRLMSYHHRTKDCYFIGYPVPCRTLGDRRSVLGLVGLVSVNVTGETVYICFISYFDFSVRPRQISCAALSLKYAWLLPERSASSSVFPAISLGFTVIFFSAPPAISLGFTIFIFFFCVPSYISGLHHPSSSVFPAVSLGFTIIIIFFFCVPSYISGIYPSSSSSSYSSSSSSSSSFYSAFPAISLALPSVFFFSCVPTYISGLHHFG